MPRRISEEIPHREMIDPQFEKKGWYLADHAKVKTEISVDGYNAEPGNGFLITRCIAKVRQCWRGWGS